MAKRDPYHHSPRQNYCSCANDAVPWHCENCRRPENRQRRRQARHDGKREAHAAAIDAATEQDERYWVDLCYAEFFPEGSAYAWWPMTDEDPVPTPGPLATLVDALT